MIAFLGTLINGNIQFH